MEKPKEKEVSKMERKVGNSLLRNFRGRLAGLKSEKWSKNLSLSYERAKNFKEVKKMGKKTIAGEWKSLLLQLAGLTAGVVLVLASFQSPVFAEDIENKLSTSNGTTAFQIRDSNNNPVAEIDSLGRLGVGTTDPQGKLHVISNSTTDPYVFVTSHTTTGFGIVVSTGGKVGIGTTSPTDKLDVRGGITFGGTMPVGIGIAPTDTFTYDGDTLRNYGLTWYDDSAMTPVAGTVLGISDYRGIRFFTSGAHAVTINGSGNVGIGATNPTHKLRVEGGIIATSSITANAGFYGNGSGITGVSADGISNTGDAIITADSDSNDTGAVILRSGSTNVVYVSTSNNVGIGTTGPSEKLEVAGNALIDQVIGRTSNDLYLRGNFLLFKSKLGDTEYMRITSTGNVGIGTTNPGSYKLNVAGSVSIDNGQIYTNGGNELFITDAAGSNQKQLQLGYDVANDRSYIQSIHQGSAYTNLLLNPNGGYVGIGTATADERLTIASGNIKLYSLQNTADAYRYIGTEYNTGNGNNKAEIRFAIDGADTKTRLTFHTANGAGTLNEQMRITSSGKVGIGTTEPGAKLEVQDSTTYTPTSLILSGSEPSRYYGLIRPYTTGGKTYLGLGVRSDNTNYFDTVAIKEGNVGIGETNPGAKLQVSQSSNSEPAGLFINGGGTGEGIRIKAGAGGTTFAVLDAAKYDGTSLLYVRGDGNVGIGTTDPGVKLDVSGNIRALGYLYSQYTDPILQLYETDAGTDQKTAEFRQQGGVLSGRFVNDAYSLSQNWIDVYRSSSTYTVDKVIFPNGNVGIGATEPGARLEVEHGANANPALQISRYYDGGKVRFKSGGETATYGEIGQTDYAGAGQQRLWMGINLNSFNAAHEGPTQANSNAASWFSQWSSESDTYSVNRIAAGGGSTASTALLINSSGNVGIGTTSPQGKLHILSNSTTDPYVFVTSHTTTGFGIVVSTGGNVGIGTTNPLSKLSVGGNGYTTAGIYGSGGTYGIWGSGGTYGIWGSGGTYGVYGDGGTYGYGVKGLGSIGVYGEGSTYDFYGDHGEHTDTSGNWVNASDIRLKTDITPLTDSLAKIETLTPVSFKWKDTALMGSQQNIGLIAQDVQLVFPELVSEDASGTLGLNYAGFVTPIIGAIKELNAKIDAFGKVGIGKIDPGYLLDVNGTIQGVNAYAPENISATGDVSGSTISAGNGASGSFTTADGKTVTVVNGIITSIQ
jgi:hypothetical protein